MAPINNPTNVVWLSRFIVVNPAATPYAASRAKEVRAAEPMANPLPVAAVVFPKASRASVRSRTSAGNPACSAIPPALSATGP